MGVIKNRLMSILECLFSGYLQVTVGQEILATGKFREFRVQAIRVHEIFANFGKVEVLLAYSGNISVQEIFADLLVPFT